MTQALSIPLVDLGAGHRAIHEDLMAAMAGVVDRGDFVMGEEVRRFEEEFAHYCGARECVSVASGTDAVRLALEACGVGTGDEVITCTHTFIATVFAIVSCGATPVLVDCDPDFYTMDVERVARAITPRTRAIVPVHLYGQPADMDPILQMARDRQLVVVEDSCQAHGAEYKGVRCGALGDIAAFSFYPAKNLGSLGDGGAVVTNRPELADRVRLLRNYGQRARHEHVVKGGNSRLDTLQAAVLRVKLRHLDRGNEARRRIAATYDRLLAGTALTPPAVAPYGLPAFHLYVVRTRRRAALQSALAAAGIAHGVHYPAPTHMQEALRDLGYGRGSFPVAEAIAPELLSLPMFPELSDGQIGRIVEACRAV